MRTEPLCDELRKRLAARQGEFTVIGGLESMTLAPLHLPHDALGPYSMNQDAVQVAPWAIAWLERKLRALRRYRRRHGRAYG